MGILAVLALFGALVIGLVLYLLLRRRNPDRQQPGMSPQDILGPAVILGVIFLAFVLASAAASYASADRAASGEADAVDHLFELAEYAPEQQRQQIQGAMVCYSRAVIAHEWRIADGSFSPMPSRWSSGVRVAFADLNRAGSSAFGMLVSADKDRATQRRDRLSESMPKTPPLLFGFVILVVSLALIAFALLLPTQQPGRSIAALVGFAVIFTMALFLMWDIERPFTGAVRLDPAAMVDTRQDIAADFVNTYGAAALPCDDTGQAR